MFQVIIVMVDNGYMVQVPPPQVGGPPQQPKTLVFPDVDSAINYAREVFAHLSKGMSEAVGKQADLLAAAEAETAAAVGEDVIEEEPEA